MNLIPKIIHYCWFGRKPMPELAQKCLKSWDEYLPDYKKVLWNEDTFDVYSNPYTREAYLCGKYAFVSDYVRLYALYHDGGIYMDTDIEILKSIDEFLEYPAFSGFENPYYIQTGIMGAVAGHPWIKRAFEHYQGRTFLRDGAMDMIPNVVYMTELLEQEFGLKKGNEQQVLKDDIHIFPNDFFCPKVFHTKEIILTENSHAIHHFAASWFNAEPAEQQSKKEGGRLGKHKICVYAICKNEEQFVDRWMDSVSEADLVIVADTGSTDNTVEKLRQRGAQVYSFENKPFRFDYSRNYALNFVPDDVDICVSPDLDEVFNPGWRKNLDEQWRDDTTRGTYLYNWSFAEDGTPMVQYVHERIHARKNYHWIYPTHEMLEYTGPGEEKRQYFDGVIFNHHPDPKKDRSLNLPLLELAYEERPNDGRTLHYLGREYLYAQMWEKCINILKRYLEPGVSDWDEERSASMRFIARAYGGLGNVYEQKRWLYKAMAETPYLREPYVELEQLAYKESDWPAVYFFALQALKIQTKTMSYVNEGFAWDQTPDDLCAIACYWLGLYSQSAAHAKAALEMKPDDERLKNNLKLIEEKLKEET